MAMFRRAAILLIIPLAAACTAANSDKQAEASGVSIPLWAMSSSSAEAKQHLNAAERLGDGGRINEAYQESKRAVAADSAFGFAYLRVAQRAQSFDEYRINLQRAQAYETTANPTEKLLIEMERKRFDRDQQGALELAHQLVKSEPSNVRSWGELITNQISSGDVAGARLSAKKALDLSMQYGGSHLAYGRLLVQTEPKDLAQAETHILEGGKLWPREPLSYDYLGDLRRAQGRLEEAAVAYTRQIEMDPKANEGYDQRGHAYTFLGKYDQARADYDAAVRLSKGNDPSIETRYRAYAAAYAGDIPKALKELEELKQAVDGMKIPEPDGEKINILDDEFVLATHARMFDVAERALAEQRPLQMKFVEKTNTPEFRRGAEADLASAEARLAVFKGEYARADGKIAEYMRLVEKDRNPTKLWRVHALKGFEALFQKKYREAITEFDQAAPDAPYIWYHRALALEGAGNVAEAKAEFKKVATYNFNNAAYAAVRADAIKRAQ